MHACILDALPQTADCILGYPSLTYTRSPPPRPYPPPMLPCRRSHASQLVEGMGPGQLQAFVRGWRQHFLDTMQVCVHLWMHTLWHWQVVFMCVGGHVALVCTYAYVVQRVMQHKLSVHLREQPCRRMWMWKDYVPYHGIMPS